MIFTSDKEFFDKIGEKETKRYFEESYNFICSYKNLGEKNIISAVVHLDEGTPHMHLIYIPVIHTKDKEGKVKYVVGIFGKVEIVTGNYKMLFLNTLLQKDLN